MSAQLFRKAQRYLIPSIFASLYYYLKFGCFVSSQSKVQLSSLISIGKGTVVKPFSIIQTQTGRISIGKQCAIGSFNHISTGIKDVIIQDYVRIGPNVTLMGGSRNFRKKDLLVIEQGSYNPGLSIGKDVLIGAGAVILPGCDIGEGAVIGAGSIVSKCVPEYAIVAGVPANVIGYRE